MSTLITDREQAHALALIENDKRAAGIAARAELHGIGGMSDWAWHEGVDELDDDTAYALSLVTRAIRAGDQQQALELLAGWTRLLLADGGAA